MSLDEPKTRQMEKAYHLLFSQIADHCIANGIDLKMVTDKLEQYRPEISPQFVKSIWKCILQTKTGKTSTTEMTKEDVKEVQAEFSKFWEEITGEQILWPSVESQLLANSDDPRFQ